MQPSDRRCRHRIGRSAFERGDFAFVRPGEGGRRDGYTHCSEKLAAAEVEVDCFVVMLGHGGSFCAPYRLRRTYRNLTTVRQNRPVNMTRWAGCGQLP